MKVLSLILASLVFLTSQAYAEKTPQHPRAKATPRVVRNKPPVTTVAPTQNLIQGNYIGTDSARSVTQPFADGLTLEVHAPSPSTNVAGKDRNRRVGGAWSDDWADEGITATSGGRPNQVTNAEIIKALNNGTQVRVATGDVTGDDFQALTKNESIRSADAPAVVPNAATNVVSNTPGVVPIQGPATERRNGVLIGMLLPAIAPKPASDADNATATNSNSTPRVQNTGAPGITVPTGTGDDAVPVK